MRNKSTLRKATIGLVVSVTVFASTALVALGNNSGYERFKAAMLNTMKAKSMTVDTDMAITANDTIWQKAQIKEMIGEEAIKSKVISTDRFGEVDEYDSTYSNTGLDGLTGQNYTEKQERLISLILDYAIKDAKNYVLTEDNKVYANLSEAQVPEIYQAFLSVISEAFAQDYALYMEYEDEDDFETQIAKAVMTDDFAIKNIYGEGKYSEDNFIESIKFVIEFGGYDTNKEYKFFELDMFMEISNINNTHVEKEIVTY